MKKAEEGTLSLKQELRKMKDELVLLDQGSAEFRALANEAAALEDTIKDVDAQVRFLSSDTKNLDTAVQAVQGFAGGFQAAQGAAALFGAESQEVQKAIQNIIAVQGIMNGVQQVTNVLQRESILGARLRTGQIVKWAKATKVATVAQKAFNMVLKANPIGLVVTAIGLLIAGFALFTDKLSAVGDWFIKLGGWVKSTIDGFGEWKLVILALLGPIGWLIAAWDFFFGEQAKHSAEQLARLEEEKKAREVANKRNVEDHKRRLNEIAERRKAEKEAFEDQQTIFDLEIERQEAQGKNAQALRIAKQEAVIQEIKDQITAIKEIEKSWTEYYERQAKAQGKSRDEYIEILKNQGIDVMALQEELNGELETLDQKLFSAESGLIKLKLQGTKDANKEEVESEEEKNKRLLEEKNKYLAQLEKLENEYLDSLLDDQDREINAVRDKYFTLIEEAKKYDRDTTILVAAREKEIAEINEKFRLKDLEEQNKIRKLNQDNALNALENELKAKEILSREDIQNRLELQLEGFELERELALQQKDLTEAEIFAIEENYRQQTLDAQKAAAEEAANARIDTINKVEKTVQDVLSITESLQTIFHGKELKRIKEKRDRGEKLTQSEIKRLKREDQIRKAQALAQIASDTARGISGAIAAGAGIPFPANLAAIASGVAAVLSGVAQASQVLGESVDIGNVSTGIGGGGDVPTDFVEETGQPQLDPLGFGSTLLNQPQKVFVVESDITDTQNNVQVLEESASFG